jgi:hypothetical protein
MLLGAKMNISWKRDFQLEKTFFFCLTGLKMIIGVAFCGCQLAKVTIYSEDEIGVKRRR